MTTEPTPVAKDMSGYKGDSIGKKIARVILWSRVLEHLYVNGLDDGRIAYLASRDGGDAATLRAMGWPDEQQLAIDRDPGALAAFSEKFPTIPTALGDVGQVLSRSSERFSAVYVDSCSTGTNPVLDLVSKCVQCVRPRGRFAYCAMRGRERGAKSTSIKEAGRSRKAFLTEESPWHDIHGRGPVTEEDVESLRKLDPEFMKSHDRITDGRSDFFETYVQRKLLPLRIYILYMTSIVYHSETRDNAGVPMMIDDWVVDRMGRGMSLDYYYAQRSKVFGAMVGARIRDYNEYELEIRKTHAKWSVLMSISKLSRLSICNVDLHNANEGTLAEFSYLLEAANVKPARALNMGTGSLAALRAHHTQGRYEIGQTYVF